MIRRLSSLGLRLLAFTAVAACSRSAPADVDYFKDIKPLLATKCGSCHGVLKQEAGLRLDASQLIRQGGDSGPAFESKNAAESLIVQRVSADESERMPPAGEGEPLKPEQIALLTEWIEAGAPAPDTEEAASDPRLHWAFQPPVRPELPSSTSGHSANAIDLLLDARRQSAGLVPVTQADRSTLLRRVYFDLIGLPPTRADLKAFLAEDSESAYVRVIDDLLSRPEYGERWGRHWMDVWRYSDWDGFGAELRGSQKHIWHWRDWIVESLNADKPYDQMVREMLAGDEIAPEDTDLLRATGFLSRNYYKFNRQMWLDGVVEHTGKAFLGLTLNCAKCHDHKYDPLAHTDYYRFQAIFEPYNVRLDRLPGQPDIEKDGLSRIYDATPETATYLLVRGDERNPDKSTALPPGVPEVFETELKPEPVSLPTSAFAPFLEGPEREFLQSQVDAEVASSRQALSDAEKRLALADQRLKEFQKGAAGSEEKSPILRDDFAALNDALWEPALGQWQTVDGHLRQVRVSNDTSRLVAREEIPRDFHARFKVRILGGMTWHSAGLNFDWQDERNFTSVYLSANEGGSKVQVSSSIDGTASYPAEGMKALPIQKNQIYTLDVFVRDRLLNVLVDGQLAVVYQLPQERRPGRFAVWSFDSQADFLEVEVSALESGVVLASKIEEASLLATTVEQAQTNQGVAATAAILARRRLAATEGKQRSFAARLEADRAEFLNESPEVREKLAREASRAERTAGILQAEFDIADAEQKLVTAQQALKPDDAAAVKARDEAQAAVADRQKQLETARSREAEKAYEHVGPLYPQSSTGRRLALAEWITDRQNPLAARVAVNHIWMRHFGKPLVENVFDFGLRTPRPLHVDVLDWLAVELMENNWSQKRIHRLIVTSQTYRQATAPSQADETAWAINRERDPENTDLWHAEIRRLDGEAIRDAVLTVSGSLDRGRSGPDIDYALGEQVPRRSLYFRHAYEKQMRFLTTFDAASPNECYRRSESIIPHQALAMANSRLTLDQSRVLAQRLNDTISALQASKDANDDVNFIALAFETILARSATEEELAACNEFLSSQRTVLAKPETLTAFVGGDDPQHSPAADPAQRARENLVHVLFNHNDFATVR